jgi:hypothetical protein
MKPLTPLLLSILLYIPVNLSAQDSPSKWHWGLGAGVNTLWIPKGGMDVNIGLAKDEKKASIKRVGNQFGYQFMGNVRYHFNKRWGLAGGIGITKANSRAYRKIKHEGHFLGIPTESITFDTIALKHLLLDAKVSVRFQITNYEPRELNINLFLDLGAVGELLLKNKATYSYSRNYNDYSYSHGKLNMAPVAPFIAVGMVGQHFDLSLGFSLLSYSSAQDNHSYGAVLTRLTYSWYF